MNENIVSDEDGFIKTLENLESSLLKDLFYKEFDKAKIVLKKENSLLKFAKAVRWLLSDINSLSLSPSIKNKLQSRGINTVLDIAFLRPLRKENYTLRDIGGLNDGEYCAIRGVVRTKNRTNRLTSITLAVDGGFLFCNWFRLNPFIRRLLNSIKPGDEIVCEGQIKISDHRFYMNHPIIKTADKFAERTEIVYPSILGMRNSSIKKIVGKIKENMPKKPYDYLPYTVIAKNKLPLLSSTIEYIHNRTNDISVDKRLKYEELFLLIFGLRLQREELRKQRAPKINIDDKFVEEFSEYIDFELTNGQKNAISDILNDLGQKEPMLRLLQGDVGCGKTIVALSASIAVAKSGYQVAFMAPTQPLASQIFNEAKKLLNHYNFNVALLLSSTKDKDLIYEDIKKGKIQIVVGTHALLQEGVQFENLGFIVIDEQHRFGVEQRKNLMSKGRFPHVLIMSATPIPRSLSMVLYSRSSMSIIKEKPAGRAKVESFHFYSKQKSRAYEMAICEMRKRHQVYVVVPLIEESESMDNMENLTKLYEELRDGYFSDFRVGFLHGQMKPEDKDSIIGQFKAEKLDCLVSTTVIEVGIDSPNATVIIVENAERFGLSQLHQLRGRVGRSSLHSFAIFITADNISESAKRRIDALLSTNDGFEISEIDYRLRGSGEMLGTRQHGKDLAYADIVKDVGLIKSVKQDVDKLVKMNYPVNEGLKAMIEYKWQTKINYVFVG